MDILAEFDDETQLLLKEVDFAMATQVEKLREEAKKASLASEELVVDTETLVWLKIIKAYGILYNRAIDAGWMKDIMLEADNNGKET